MRILLAEDNELNQDLAVRLLSKHGHEVTLAQDGQLAVEMYTAEPSAFELILMDLRMPRLDGYAATRAIRKAESAAGARIPILAMSAHADRADVRRALQAGMDGHIAKPIDVRIMLETIESALRGSAFVPAPDDAEQPPIDWEGALDLVGGDAELLEDVARRFLGSEPRLTGAVRDAIAALDAAALEEAAHRLRGALGNFTAGSAYDTAKRLEELGAAGDLAEAPDLCARLEVRMSAVRSALTDRLDGR